MQNSKSTKRFWTPVKTISGVISLVWLIVWALISDRLTGWGNNMIAEWLANHQGLGWRILSWILENPFNLMSAIAVFILMIIIVDWYRRIKKQDKQPEVKEVKKISIPITKTVKPLLAILGRFSSHLDEITKGENISSLGTIFLNRIKTAPPFLGLQQSVMPPRFERDLIEYFLATEFKKANGRFIRGGGDYTITTDDASWKSISKKIYGSVKFTNQLQASNPLLHDPRTGVVIELPYIHTSNPIGLSSKDIERKLSVAEYSSIEPTLKSLINQFNLIEDEALRLMKMIYDAAQRTHSEVNETNSSQV